MTTCAVEDVDPDTGTHYYCTFALGHPDNGDGTITHCTSWLGPDPANPDEIPWTYTNTHEWTVPVDPAP